MSDATNLAKLKDTLRTMRTNWQALRQEWRDPASDTINREVFEPAEDAVRTAILALEQLSQAIDHAKRDCDGGEGY